MNAAAKSMMPADVAEAQRLAREWRPRREQPEVGNISQPPTGVDARYFEGERIPQDYAEAVKRYRPEAEHGDADAQYNLGVIYERGQGILRDYVEAVRWYRAAAEQGHAHAQFSLGVMYHSDLGVPLDDVQALMWLSLAASRFPPGEDHDRAIQGRDTLAANMTPAQITKARRLAGEWRPRGEQPE
jgi:TPR repeat protein